MNMAMRLQAVFDALFHHGDFYTLDEIHTLAQRHGVTMSADEIREHLVDAGHTALVVGQGAADEGEEYWGAVEVYSLPLREAAGSYHDSEIEVILLLQTQRKLMTQEVLSEALNIDRCELRQTLYRLVSEAKLWCCEYGNREWYGPLELLPRDSFKESL